MRSRALLLSLMLVSMACSAEAEVDPKALKELLSQIPSQDVLDRFAKLVNGREKAKSDEEMTEAKQAIERVKTAVPELRKLIKVGRTVFDYPGMLGRGRISFSDPGYSMYVGVYLLRHEGHEPYDFWIDFDGAGRITAVEDVIWRR